MLLMEEMTDGRIANKSHSIVAVGENKNKQ